MGLTMGYRRERTINVVFDDLHPREDMRGFEAVMRRLSAREMLHLDELRDLDDAASIADQRKAMEELFAFVADKVVTWNLEDDDGPVPATVETLLDQDLGFVTALADAWTDLIAGVSAPLDQTSSAGVPSPAASIPMDDL